MKEENNKPTISNIGVFIPKGADNSPEARKFWEDIYKPELDKMREMQANQEKNKIMSEEKKYIKLCFKSIKSGSSFFKLNCKDEVLSLTYTKYISSYDELDENEKAYIFSDYIRIREKLSTIVDAVNS